MFLQLVLKVQVHVYQGSVSIISLQGVGKPEMVQQLRCSLDSSVANLANFLRVEPRPFFAMEFLV